MRSLNKARLCLAAMVALSATFARGEAVGPLETPETLAKPAPPEKFEEYSLDNFERYEVRAEPSTPEQRAEFEALSPKEQEAFLKRREAWLGGLAKFLNSGHVALGAGAVSKDRIAAWINPGKQANNPPVIDDLNALAEPSVTAPSMRERGHMIAQNMMTAVNNALWNHPDRVAANEELGVEAVLPLMIEQGQLHKGIGGLNGPGVKFGLNFKDKGITFEIFQEFERYQYARPAMVTYGVPPKLGVYLRSGHGYQGVHKGITDYPPLVPLYTRMSDHVLAFGISTGSATTFPTVGSDLMSYVNDNTHVTWFKFRAGFGIPGFVRVHSSAPEAIAENISMKHQYEELALQAYVNLQTTSPKEVAKQVKAGIENAALTTYVKGQIMCSRILGTLVK